MLIDSNIFLELFLEQQKKDACRLFLNKTINGEINAIISNFTIDSVLLVMFRHGSALEKMRDFLHKVISSKGLSIYSITSSDRLRALQLIENYKLDYEDAIVLQSAISAGHGEILSFDKDFDKIKEIKRIEP